MRFSAPQTNSRSFDCVWTKLGSGRQKLAEERLSRKHAEELRFFLDQIARGKKFPVLGKSNEAVSQEAASLSEEGYRRADCSPPELTCVTLGG
jgi:hypothetical protein